MTQGSCPSCGAPVAFTAGSAQVVVCEHCQTVVARAGDHLEARGKVARILASETPFQLGLTGRYRKTGFRLVGHLQKRQGAGALWDEWYAEFDDGRTGWLAESEGAFHLTFFEGQEPGRPLRELRPGRGFPLRGLHFVVEEVGQAAVVSAAGQLPGDVSPTEAGNFVDATGPGGRFATLDFGPRTSDPELFLGQRVELAELGIPPDQLTPRVRRVQLQQARCTHCNGPLELRAPDQSKRVGCPYCGALLDVREGKLAFLQLLEKPKEAPLVPLGARGRLFDAEWVCVGFLLRSCTVDGVRYPWAEYLLYQPALGFRWLVHSTGHWTFLAPVPAGEVRVARGTAAFWNGRRYRAFQTVKAVTEAVQGEFYWEVRAGDTVWATEYVDPPRLLSEETTAEEVSFSQGEYVEAERVRAAFGVKTPFPRPYGIASSQPNPHAERLRGTGRWLLGCALALGALFLADAALSRRARVFDQEVQVPAGTAPGSAAATFLGDAPLELTRRANLRLELEAGLAGEWLGVEGELVREGDGQVLPFYLEVAHWTGGAARASDTEYLSRVPPGRYTLRLVASYDAARAPVAHAYRVRLTSDVPRPTWLFWALLLTLVAPVLGWMRVHGFESRRWAESSFGGGDDDEEED